MFRFRSPLLLACAASLASAAGISAQGWGASLLLGYHHVASHDKADFEHGAGAEYLITRYWASGVEVGIGATAKLHRRTASVLISGGDPGRRGLEPDLTSVMGVVRYWFSGAGPEFPRPRAFVGVRAAFARYVFGEVEDDSGAQLGLDMGVWAPLIEGAGLVGSVAFDGFRFAHRRRFARDDGFFYWTTRLVFQAGVRVAVS